MQTGHEHGHASDERALRVPSQFESVVAVLVRAEVRADMMCSSLGRGVAM